MDNSEHQKDCICAWCEAERQNAEIERERTASGPLDAAACSALLDAVERLLPQHSIACVSGFKLYTKPWSFDTTDDGKPLVTEESCQCDDDTKRIRKWLSQWRKSPKGFYLPNVERTHR